MLRKILTTEAILVFPQRSASREKIQMSQACEHYHSKAVFSSGPHKSWRQMMCS